MSSGVAGGQLGGAIARGLVARYGEAKASIGVGAVVIAGSLVIAVLFFVFQPIVTEAQLVTSDIHVTRFAVRQSSLDIWSNEVLFTARPRLWRPQIKDNDLIAALTGRDTITVWLYPNETRLYGLVAGSLRISPSAGVAEYMNNRWWFAALWIGFLVGGIVTLGYGFVLRRRGGRLRCAA